MNRNYKFHNPEGVYFISFAVVEWLDVFTRVEYKKIIIDSLHQSEMSRQLNQNGDQTRNVCSFCPGKVRRLVKTS